MWIEPLFAGIALGGTLVAAWVRARRASAPRALPPAGEPPADRSEAVRRVLKHLQRRSIGALEEGAAAVIAGVARPLPGVPLLRSPIHGVPCLGYHLSIRGAQFDYSLSFPRARDLARCAPFELVDETGTVRVASEGLELAITDAPAWRCDPPLPRELLAQVPPACAGWSLIIEEGVLLPGGQVLVCGVAVRELAAADHYRESATSFVLRATSTFPLVASTDADLFEASDRPIAPEELHRVRR